MKIEVDIEESRNQNKKESLNEIIKRIIFICKNDETFKVNKKILSIIEYEKKLIEKNSNLLKLIQKSDQMYNQILNEINELESKNFSVRVTLLESIGEEL